MSTQPARLAPVDATACEREPIHVPGAVQPHGTLLGIGADGVVCVAAANCAVLLGLGPDQVMGRPLHEVVGPDLAAWSARDALPGVPWTGRLAGGQVEAVSHASGGLRLLEVEPAGAPGPDAFALVTAAVTAVQEGETPARILGTAVREVRRLTGYERVMAYRFDPDWNGEVVAEERPADWESYLGLRFPASDIPAQARALYLRNRIRVIPDAVYDPVPLAGDPRPDGSRVDLSDAVLRSVSPVHLEYLANMGVRASMSVSLVREGRLWGLIACHHRTPRPVPSRVRTACELLAAVVAARVGEVEARDARAAEAPLRGAFLDLLAAVDRAPSVADGLLAAPGPLLGALDAAGAVVSLEGRRAVVGHVPPPEAVSAVLGWLAGIEEPVVVTERLGLVAPLPDAVREAGSGLVAVSLRPADPGWVCWFRPEVPAVVDWAGDPRKPAEPGDGGRLSPRRSFALWRETVRGRARPWSPAEIDMAWELRWSLAAAATGRAQARLSEELARSNQDLAEFADAVSHDLQAPLRAVATFAGVLGDRPDVLADPAAVEAVERIGAAAARMKAMIRGLRDWSRIGRDDVAGDARADAGAVLAQVLLDLAPALSEARAAVTHDDPLPVVAADPVHLGRVLQNLLENALRYRSGRPPCIHVGAARDGEAWRLWVRDNGIGVPEASRERIFEMFRRAVPDGGEGVGIGLAVCRRIVERAGGRIWAEAAPGGGSVFAFTLPAPRR